MKNRKNLPPGMKNLKLKEIHAISTFQCKDIPNLLCTTWLDKKQISIISNNARNGICQAHRRKGAEKLLVQCPAVFAQYNRHMGGVDLADQRRKYFSVARKSSKWWWYIISFLLDTAVSNAFILMKATNSPPPKRMYQLYDFKLELIEEFGREGCRKRVNSDFTPTEEHNHKKRKNDDRKRTCVHCRKIGLKTPLERSIEVRFRCFMAQEPLI
ncbi:hypothetical protein AVEN_111456-1 [Araneus ventricosus]|uniref:PiggyBac transposable element-derived protein domain-containing protein n=1 Tax=Araneus ventricosus TaxID=182803 RepID=A0A4Y2K2I3_ARAVE|nr:hypothetical protein AVEN_111456-1 [Araneus ventricosus]